MTVANVDKMWTKMWAPVKTFAKALDCKQCHNVQYPRE